jgi:DNA-binding MarR family transcriptional regulator
MARKSLLQREIRQRMPFSSPGQEAILAMLRTSDHLRRHLSSIIEPKGITRQQYNVLRILRGAGDEGLPTLGVAVRMIEHAPGITRLIDRLESKGLVERRRPEGDRRVVICHVAPAGLALLAELDEAVDAFDRAALSALSEKEQKTVILLLEKVRAACPKG